MNNYYYYNPTKIIFGKNVIENISREIPNEKRVLLIYGGGSIKKNGVYEQVKKLLINYAWYEFGGISENPEYEKCMQAVEYIRAHNIDYLLAVGGGSVIDATKFIALAYYSKASDDPWDFMQGKTPAPTHSLPFGCILTMPATGSEMNNAFVISRAELTEKVSGSSFASYPKFSALDPETTFSLSDAQTALGIVDIFIHVLEQYLTYPTDFTLQERQAEAILLTILEVSPKLLQSPNDYGLRANIMWCATQALNGHLSRGVPLDWATHEIGHQLTALYGLVHAQSIAIVLPGVWRNQFSNKRDKLIQYGQRVWGLSGTANDVAEKAIDKTEHFFNSLGVGTRLSDYDLNIDEVVKDMANQVQRKGLSGLGEHNNIGINEIAEVLMLRK